MAQECPKMPEPATLTEKQLWERFSVSRIQTTYSMGPTVDSFCPAELLRDSGAHGTMQEFGREVHMQLAETDSPEAELACVISDLAAYLDDLQTVRDAFARLRDTLAIEPDDGGEVLYREPVIQSREAA